jgi:hypothetical protein
VINRGQALLTGPLTVGELPPLCLTYCVPFAVAMYSQAQGKRQRDLSTRELVVTNEPLRRRRMNSSSSGRLLSAYRHTNCT